MGLLAMGFLSTPYVAVNVVNVLSVHHLASPSWLAELAQAPAVGGLGHLTDAQARAMGREAAAAGRVTEAIRWYSEVSPVDPVSSARESDLLLVQGEPRAAMQLLANAHGDRLVLAWVQTEWSAGRTEQFVPAVANLSLSSLPVDGAVQFLVGEASIKRGDSAAAERAFARSRQDDPTDPWPSIRLADLAFADGHPDAAREILTAQLRLDPGEVWTRLYLGRLLVLTGEYQAAAETLEVVSNEPRPNEGVLMYLSRAQMGQGDAAGALATVCRGLRARPNSAELLAVLRELSPASSGQACTIEEPA
jgi:Flp pilus assembly protein TadD